MNYLESIGKNAKNSGASKSTEKIDLKGNIAKYLWREHKKGGVQSLKKARWYLDKLISLGG